jgi:hypothetical protein
MRALPLFMLVASGCAGATAAEPRGSPRGLVATASPPLAALDASVNAEPAEAAAPPDGARRPSEPAQALPRVATDEPTSAAPRLTSQGYVTWIWPRAKARGRFIGYVRVGQSVALRSPELVRGEGCAGGFYAIEPRGFVCRDRTVTLDPSPRFVEAARLTESSPGPHPFRYAISNGAPMYNRVPTEAEQRRTERPLGPAGQFKKLSRTLAAHEDLAVTEPITATEPLPAFLRGGEPVNPARLGLVARSIPWGSMLSFQRVFDVDGRAFLLSTDNTLVPADRARRFEPSSFRGTRLDAETKLPIAWVRGVERAKWRQSAGATMSPTGAAFPVRSFVELTGQSIEQNGKRWLETRETDPSAPGEQLFIAERDAAVVSAASKRPIGLGSVHKWILVRITQGTLVAYEGLSPVYTTLISPGAGGVPVAGQDPVKASTTPLGVYFVTFKDRAATMSPDKDPENRTFWIADVPHTQYFDPPFALHAAYWHERFGEPTSAGCINLSPIDAEALFRWSDPPVPDGWQGATGAGAPENGPTTAIVVRR